MLPKEIKKVLDKNGAISDYYKICDFPIQKINGKMFLSDTDPFYVDNFVNEFINNIDIEHIIYIYDINESIFRINKDIKIKDIRWFESNIFCEPKLRIKKINKIKDVINK